MEYLLADESLLYSAIEAISLSFFEAKVLQEDLDDDSRDWFYVNGASASITHSSLSLGCRFRRKDQVGRITRYGSSATFGSSL